jgi:hypothetical protein
MTITQYLRHRRVAQCVRNPGDFANSMLFQHVVDGIGCGIYNLQVEDSVQSRWE